jgi:hypothetical protein
MMGILRFIFACLGETYQFDFPHFSELVDFLETACLNPKP